MKQHTSLFLGLVADAKTRIREIDVGTLYQKINQKDPLTIIDVREDHEWVLGHIPEAMHLSKGVIERDIEKTVPDQNTPILVYCSGGFRCALVADSLQNMGYKEVYSLAGGLQDWENQGYPLVVATK